MSDREVALKLKILTPEKWSWKDGSRLKDFVALPEEQVWFQHLGGVAYNHL